MRLANSMCARSAQWAKESAATATAPQPRKEKCSVCRGRLRLLSLRSDYKKGRKKSAGMFQVK